MQYRKEIDGLRTLAVISVIIYHAQFFISREFVLPGGFLGVDIFFVISGYLISFILMKEIESTGQLSIRNFYIRRIRRIIPLLLTVILVTSLLAWRFLLPEDLVNYAESVFSSLGFFSNYYFYFQSIEYDAQSSLTIPLLHTWSLSVEEQFYLIFPIFLIFCFKFAKQYLLYIIGIAFIVNISFAAYFSQQNPELSFFSFQTRIWELLAGVLLAAIEIKKGREYNKSIHFLFSFIGLSLVGYSFFAFNDDTVHPGLLTLVPIIGTMLIIHFSNPKEPVGFVLSTKLFVGIGLISYSLYLWHYPVFAFGNILNPDNTSIDKFIWIAITFVLSIISYYLIENPFRNRKKIKTIGFSFAVSSILLMLIGFSYFSISTGGYRERLPAVLASFLNDLDRKTIIKNKHEFIDEACKKNGLVFDCKTKNSNGLPVSLIGDSHMGALRGTLTEKLLADNHNVRIITKGGCWPIVGFNRINKETGLIDQRCDVKLQSFRFKKAIAKGESIVVIAGRLPLYLTGERFNNKEGGRESRVKSSQDLWFKYVDAKNKYSLEKGIKVTIKKLLKKGSHVVVIYPIPEVGISIKRKILRDYEAASDKANFGRSLVENPITTSYKVYKERTESSFALLDSIKHKNLYRVYPHKLFCNNTIKGRCITHTEKHILYSDSHHPGYYGSKLINKEVARVIRKIEKKRSL